ncbi:hypothetical protein H3294_23310, partial [Providencia stuartii]|nr:hypothetical protein [Providencia stuartii]
MTDQKPKAFDFGADAQPAAEPASLPAAPRAFDFGEAGEAAPPAGGPPRALSFDD